ncbi:MAG: hypothetical protein EA357_00090 [Micavibrio sp.]|nr:MAG: hypothetical protein EA357_00090 [Micavibrio sp.]
MTDITLTAALRTNLLSLQRTQGLLDITQNRLATGRKVNSALDNANSFFSAQSLNFRGSDLARLLDGIGQSVQTLKAADQGITSLVKLVEQAEAIAQTAREGQPGYATIISGNIPLAEQNDLTAEQLLDGDYFTLQAGSDGVVETFTITDGMSLADLVALVDAADDFSAQILAPGPSGDPTDARLEIRATNGQNLITESFAMPDLDGPDDFYPLPYLWSFGDSQGTVNGTQEASEDIPGLEADFNALLQQIDFLARDSGYRGTNLLNGSNLTVQFNESNTSFLVIAGVTFDSEGLEISAADFGSIETVETALSEVRAALDTLRSQARTFGGNMATIQVREEFTKGLINTLKEGSDKLTLADINEEGAKLLSLQTAQQLGITSLALASQAQQSVLRLF